jgi:hypothetical protein
MGKGPQVTRCACGTLVIVPVGRDGQRMPAVNRGSDPAGTVAVEQEVSGTWRGTWPRPGETVRFPRKRFRVHDCGAAS